MSPKYALLYFIKDRVFDIVRVCQVSKLSPNDEHDYVKDRVYMVEWKPSSTSSKSASDCLKTTKYPAVIIKLSESETELQKVLDSGKRIRIPNVTTTATEPDVSSDDEVIKRQKHIWNEAKKKQKDKVASSTRRLKDVLAVSAQNPLCVSVEHSPKSKSGLTRKRTLSYITDSEEECTKCKELSLENKKMKEENQKLRNLNMKLQTTLLEKLEGLTGVQGGTKEHPKATHSRDTRPAPTSAPSPPAERKVGNSIHILDPEELRVLDRKSKPSLFAKNLCVRLIGTEKLRNSSLDGRIPSRGSGAPRDALDPQIVETIKDLVCQRYGDAEKMKVNRYIIEKIADLRKLKVANTPLGDLNEM